MSGGPILHATLIARRMQGRWAGVLVRGPSSAGKSDLALRALATGWRLVADDRVRVWASGGKLYGAAPPNLAGRIEARSVDVVRTDAIPVARIRLLISAVGPDGPDERIPAPVMETVAGVALPCFTLALLEASAPLKLGLALDAAARDVV